MDRHKALEQEGKFRSFAGDDLLENSLKNVEMALEQNYNSIDGCLNNIDPKPSVRDTLRQYQEETAQRAGVPPNKDRER